MGHSRDSTGGLAQLRCIHVAQPWELCPRAHKRLVETVSLFFIRYLRWDGRVEKCQRTWRKDSAQDSGA